MNKSVKKETNIAAGVGIGGFHCACCNPFHGCTKKQGKTKLNRILRRINKQNLTANEKDQAFTNVHKFYNEYNEHNEKEQ